MIVTLSGGLNATTAPIDWDAEFGTGLPHVGCYVPDRHDASEASSE